MKSLITRAALALSVAASGCVAALADTKVGLLLPYSGVYAALGNEITEGFKLAIAESGRKDITIVTADSEAKPPVGLEKAKKLVLEDNVDVLAGVVSSAVFAAIRDFVHESKVPFIISNAGANAATGAGCSKYVTRVSFSNAQVSRPMGKWMFDRGIKKIYTMAPDYAAGHETIDEFIAQFKAAGGEITGSGYSPFGKTEDFGPFLTAAQATKPDAIFTFYSGSEAVNFVKQYKSFGIDKTVPLYGTGFLTSQLLVAQQGDAANGVITSLHYMPSIDSPENKAFVEAFKKQTGHVPSESAVQGYDSGKVLLEALKSGAAGREAIAAAIPKVKYVGPRGPLQIDPATNNIIQNMYIYETVVKDGNATQKLLATVPNVQDPVNGCKL